MPPKSGKTPSPSTCSPTRRLSRGTRLERHHGKTFVWAKQTILCTGGAGQVYRETTNPAVATGDGHAVAYRAGAELRDMEFMQFHPTVLYIAGSSRSLITEAMRGEGALLVDADGHRFMPEYDPRAELAPRDIVSQAIVDRRWKRPVTRASISTSATSTPTSSATVPRHRRALSRIRHRHRRDRIPVRPGAHYMIGGVTVDLAGTNHPAGAVGGRRSHQQRTARRQPAGVQQPAGRLGLRCPTPATAPRRLPSTEPDTFQAVPWRTIRGRPHARTASTWTTSATRSRA